MKYRHILMAAFFSSSLITGSAFADEMLDLAKAKACLACHTIEKKLVGPAFKDVAAKYKDQADAIAVLTEKVQKGGKGTWGPIPMPANKVTNDEALKLVTWVLGQN